MTMQMFENCADFFGALANARRLEIIHLLRNQELPVKDIYTMLDLPQANISQHLTMLRAMGLVLMRRNGKQIYYRLASPKIIEACDLLRDVIWHDISDQRLAQMTQKFDQLVPLVTDPVCQMRLSPKTAVFKSAYKNRTYYFCASGCHQRFIADPTKYIGNK